MKKGLFISCFIIVVLSIIIFTVLFASVKPNRKNLIALTEFALCDLKSDKDMYDVLSADELVEKYVNIISGVIDAEEKYDSMFSADRPFPERDRSDAYLLIMVSRFACLLEKNSLSYEDYMRIKLSIAQVAMSSKNSRIKSYGESVLINFPFASLDNANFNIETWESIFGTIHQAKIKNRDLTSLEDFLAREETDSFSIDNLHLENWMFHIFWVIHNDAVEGCATGSDLDKRMSIKRICKSEPSERPL